MVKRGRNDPCPCGSGKKFKKCCLGKSKEEVMQKLDAKRPNRPWSYSEVDLISTNDIMNYLQLMGIEMSLEGFLQKLPKLYSANDFSDLWYSQFDVQAAGWDKDFPWLAAWVLWNRLAPDGFMVMEEMNELIVNGQELIHDGRAPAGCDMWLRVWEGLKFRIQSGEFSLDRLENAYRNTFFVSNFVQDLEEELRNAGKMNKQYYEKRICYCTEFCALLPNENVNILHNMRRAVIESYLGLERYEDAFRALDSLIQEYPENVWSYVEYGDTYFLENESCRDLGEAEKWYQKALVYVQDDDDRSVVEERLQDLCDTRKKQDLSNTQE